MDLGKLIKSKRVIGIIMAVIGLVLESGVVLEGLIPSGISKALASLGVVVGMMGFRDAILKESKGLVAKIVNWRSKTFWGSALCSVLTIALSPENVAFIPEGLRVPVQVLTGLLAVVGLIDAKRKQLKVAKG